MSSNTEALNDFSIDASYEFSKFVLGSKIRLTHNEQFCLVSSSECATYPKHIEPCVSILNIATNKNNVLLLKKQT